MPCGWEGNRRSGISLATRYWLKTVRFTVVVIDPEIYGKRSVIPVSGAL